MRKRPHSLLRRPLAMQQSEHQDVELGQGNVRPLINRDLCRN